MEAFHGESTQRGVQYYDRLFLLSQFKPENWEHNYEVTFSAISLMFLYVIFKSVLKLVFITDFSNVKWYAVPFFDSPWDKTPGCCRCSEGPVFNNC